MVQISKKHLDKDIEAEMYKQFWNSLSKLNSPQVVSEFFPDLLTDTEKVMLAKRFTAAILISRGKSASEIKESIHLSFSTIGSVSAWVKYARPKTQEVLKMISNEKDWQAIIDKIDSLFGKLPPAYYSNWSEAGKQKWKNLKSRSARNELR